MITQYSRVQLTLSEKEKEYSWFSYAAKIIRAGCNDQQMSGYTVTGTGIDGQEIKAELTNEELFQLFSEITMKYGRKLVTQEMEQHSLDQESDELLKPDITDRPLERRDYQIQITRHELKTRKADVTITWGNNLKVEGLYVASRVRGGVQWDSSCRQPYCEPTSKWNMREKINAGFPILMIVLHFKYRRNQ